MREIRYRAKAVVSGDYVDKEVAGKWVYGFYVESKGLCKIINHLGDFVVQKPTVGQFINLPDKNGVEIYEGDILRIGTNLIEIVSWVDQDNWVSDKCPVNGWVNNESIYKKKPEVIGNIYENPELLKESNVK